MDTQAIGAILQRAAAQSTRTPEQLADFEARQRLRCQFRRWDLSGVPRRHDECRPSRDGVWGRKLDAIAAQLGSGFIVAIIGPRGTGKTQLAVEVMRRGTFEQADHWHPADYVRAVEVFMAVRRAYDPAGPDESQALARFVNPALLVIDEAHDRSESDWENRTLNYLLDKRYGNMSDTILIANQTDQQFKASVGASAYQRLVETGGVIDTTGWPSMRLEASKAATLPQDASVVSRRIAGTPQHETRHSQS